MYLPSKNKQLVYPCAYSPPRCLRHPPLFFLILHLTFNKKRCCGNYIVESCPRPCPSYWIFLRCSHLSCICISCGNQHVTNKKGKNAPQPLSSWWFTAWKWDSFFRQLCFFCIKEDGWCVLFFFASRHSLHPSSPITLKNGGGNERFNERNGAIDPPFILMGHRSQSITGLLILLLKGGGTGRGGARERGSLAGLLRDLPPNLCILGLYWSPHQLYNQRVDVSQSILKYSQQNN